MSSGLTAIEPESGLDGIVKNGEKVCINGTTIPAAADLAVTWTCNGKKIVFTVKGCCNKATIKGANKRIHPQICYTTGYETLVFDSAGGACRPCRRLVGTA